MDSAARGDVIVNPSWCVCARARAAALVTHSGWGGGRNEELGDISSQREEVFLLAQGVRDEVRAGCAAM